MKTTAIFVEILIIGIGACVWLTLLVAFLFGATVFDLDKLKGWEGAATAFATAVAYTLGILLDRASDSLGRLLRKLTKRAKTPRRDFGMMRMRVMLEGGAVGEFLEYQRSRLRIARLIDAA